MKIAFIGGGNMASALIGGMVQQGFAGQDIYVVEPDADKRSQLAAAFGVQALADAQALPVVQLLVLAVKPQQMQPVASALAGRLDAAVVLSIAAGIELASLRRWLGGHRKLIRVMPNTPALVQAGISGAYAAPEVEDADRQLADRVLRAVGSVVWLQQEAEIDSITAVSGSGPAYVFYFLEALCSAAEGQGFSPDVARRLAYQTFAGAIKLAQASDVDAATLRARVTSKGGTTERAIQHFDASGVKAAIAGGVAAAAARSRELAAELGQQ